MTGRIYRDDTRWMFQDKETKAVYYVNESHSVIFLAIGRDENRMAEVTLLDRGPMLNKHALVRALI